MLAPNRTEGAHNLPDLDSSTLNQGEPAPARFWTRDTLRLKEVPRAFRTPGFQGVLLNGGGGGVGGAAPGPVLDFILCEKQLWVGFRCLPEARCLSQKTSMGVPPMIRRCVYCGEGCCGYDPICQGFLS